jgi:hypothetical protein
MIMITKTPELLGSRFKIADFALKYVNIKLTTMINLVFSILKKKLCYNTFHNVILKIFPEDAFKE